MKKAIICLLILSTTLVKAKEVDQLMAWSAILEDSTVQVNDFYNDLIKKFVKKNYRARTGGSASCGWNIFKLSMAINGLYSKNTLGFFKGNKNISSFPSWDMSYEDFYDKSIFKNIEMFHPDLSRIIEINGVKIGTDKIAHFFGMGFLYWLKYKWVYNKHKKRKGHVAAHTLAINAAIQVGIKGEKGIIGWKSQQTASFADLEANYHGLKFFLDFCMGDNPIVKAEMINGKNRWVVNRAFNIRDYVNPWWDETFYSNLYLPEAFEAIKPRMLPFCEQRKSVAITSRFNYYRNNFAPSYNVNYLSGLIEKGELKDNSSHSIDSVCREKEAQESAMMQQR